MAPTDSPRETQPRKYAIFISYRHADNMEMGRKWATWLHETVENYDIPADLIGKVNQRGEQVPSTLYPVFRDEEELPADADLSVNIRRALENSSLLVVLCSPRAVQSRFVADEIRHFKEIGKSNRILALMIDGEPNASDDPEKLARLGAATECFPEPLKFGVPDDSGRIDWSERTEPIAADCRPGGRSEQGWTTAAAYAEALEKQPGLTRVQRADAVREYAERLELAKLKVIAGAIGMPLGELTQRDKVRQLRRAKQRARLLAALSSVFALLAGAAAVLGWMANERRKEADIQRRDANTQRQSAVTARGVAEAEKRQAVATLAASDFQEGINRLAKSTTARSGLAYLARSARAGHASAATRIWTLFQQRSFWLPEPASAIMPAASHHRLEPVVPRPDFAKLDLDGEEVEPTWYGESDDGLRCVTVVSTAEAGEGAITFRFWEISGKPLGPWLTLDYQGDNYLSGIVSASLSDDGRFAAIVASPWRAPQYVEVWDVNKGVRIGEPIPADGGHPNYQGAAFADLWFVPREEGAPGPMLVTLSTKGNATVHRLDADPESPDLFSLVTNSHDQSVQLAEVDPAHKLFVSTAVDRSIRISSLETGEPLGWPIAVDGTVTGIHVDSADHLSVLLEGGKTAAWRLLGPTRIASPAQTSLTTIDAKGLHKVWPTGDEEEGLAAKPLVIADQLGNRQLIIADETQLKIISAGKPDQEPEWSRRFSAPIAHARFSGDDAIIVQTEFFSTEIWDVRNDLLKHPVIDEAALFTPDSSSDTVLLSSLSADGKLTLSRSFLWDPPNMGIYAFTVWDTATGKPVSDRMSRIDDAASEAITENHAEFGTDGSFLLFGRSGENAKPDVTGSLQLHPPDIVAPVIANLSEALGGFRLKPDGNLEAVTEAPSQVLDRVREKLGSR
ncbi:MAG: toll/interleukin-1 receptor domain-containing protein [Luteolibacter sp.]|uniref:toll/interleukin-1 receptor domain-containing protein n=1 Tax=Luteolibacter sp. TaxID=1962973 RepID=UPI003266951C